MRVPKRIRSLTLRPIKWALDQIQATIGRNRYGYDPFLDITRLSQAWHYPIAIFFDVGANDGATVRYARNRFVNCHIIAFEPHPNTFLKLTENVRNIKNVELINVALGREIGEKTMFEYDMPVLNSLIPNAQFAVRFKKEARPIRVQSITLDEFCRERQIQQIDVLKIDTEGFDLEVLKGASSMLARQAIRFIYFEFNDIHPKSDAAGGALAPIDQLLRSHGYRFLATYNDYVVPEGELFIVSNALYALPPLSAKQVAQPKARPTK